MGIMQALDIHDYRGRYQRALKNLREDLEISDETRNLILNFAEYCEAQGLEIPSIVRHVFALRRAARLLGKPFKEANKNDIIRLVTEIERALKKDTTQPLNEESKRNEKVSLKKFYKWLRNSEEDYPEEVRWIKPRMNNHVGVPCENLLTEQEVKRLAESVLNLRDRALILVLCESGCRVGEILSLKVGGVRFDQYGAVLFVDGKTGQGHLLKPNGS
jgi:integrase/recombinase XerD